MENELDKMTAVEWVIKELKNKEYLGIFCTADAWEEEEKQMRLIIEQAKQMEKQQHKNTWTDSRLRGDLYQNQIFYYESFNDYFKLEYGGKNGE
jgi:hypothetical protein